MAPFYSFLLVRVFTCCEKEKEGFLLICFPENFWFCLLCLLWEVWGELRRFVLMTEKVFFGCVIVLSCLFSDYFEDGVHHLLLLGRD